MVRKQVETPESMFKQQQEDMRNAEKAGLTTRMPENAFQEISNAIGVSQSDLSSSDDQNNGGDEQNHAEDTELGKLSKDNDPSRVMYTISKTVQ